MFKGNIFLNIYILFTLNVLPFPFFAKTKNLDNANRYLLGRQETVVGASNKLTAHSQVKFANLNIDGIERKCKKKKNPTLLLNISLGFLSPNK
jgi:hypothetical protein